MAKRIKHKSPINLKKPAAYSGENAIQKTPAGKTESFPDKIPSQKDPSIYYAIITLVILCFIFYGNTLRLKYAYDDLMVITGNQFTKQGIKGISEILTTDCFTGYFGKGGNIVSGGRYRPLSLVTFAIEYQVFGENPLVSHLVNVLLFSAICILLLILTRKLAGLWGIRHRQIPWYISVPFVISLLFLAHPIHTEVVANIKSRDEILALLFCLLTLYFSIKFIEQEKVHFALFSGLSFFLALLSKENSLTFFLVQPVTLYFFTRASAKKNLFALLPLVISTGVFLAIRQSVVSHANAPLSDDLMNNPFVEMTSDQKYATILYTLGLYIKLLLFPHPLTSDYYPYHIPIINPVSWQAIVPLCVYLFMILYLILKTRKRDLTAFCFIYFLITISIASNIVFPIGAFMSERFLFIPSVAFCIIMGAGIFWIGNHIPVSNVLKKLIIAGLTMIILTSYGYKTISRNTDWYDSYTLFTADVNVSKNSAKANEIAGEYIMQRASQCKDKATRDSLFRRSIAYQQKAILVYPKQIVALINLAACYYEYNKDYDTILVVYKTILKYLPDCPQVYTVFNSMMAKYDNIDHKISLYENLLEANPERYDVNMNLGVLNLGGKQDATKALPYLEKAVSLNPGDFDGHKYLGTAYSYLRRWDDARIQLEIAEKIRPGDGELNKNLAAVYQNLGDFQKAKQIMERTNRMQQQKSVN